MDIIWFVVLVMVVFGFFRIDSNIAAIRKEAEEIKKLLASDKQKGSK